MTQIAKNANFFLESFENEKLISTEGMNTESVARSKFNEAVGASLYSVSPVKIVLKYKKKVLSVFEVKIPY